MKYLIALIGVILVALSIANSVDAVQPEAQVEVVSYTVHHGDTLWSIANHYAPEHIKDIREFMWQICTAKMIATRICLKLVVFYNQETIF